MNRIRWKGFVHHEGTKDTKPEEIVAMQDFRGRHATFGNLPTVLHAKARRRKEYLDAGSIWGQPGLQGESIGE